MAEKFETFKIGDLNPNKPGFEKKQGFNKIEKTNDGQTESDSLGYDRIEDVLDHHSKEDISARFEGVLAKTHALLKTGTASKQETLAYNKVKTGLQSTLNLFQRLYQTQEDMTKLK